MQMSRRSFVLGGVGGLGLAALGGARGAVQHAEAAAAPAVQRGGEIVQASSWTYPTFDLHLSTWAPAAGNLMLFEYLLEYELVNEKTGQFQLRPALAEAWEQTDPKTVVFHLRKGIRFHDGSEFTADVAKWNLERLRDHPKSLAKTFLLDVDAVEAVDASTLRVRLKAPSSSLPFRVSVADYARMGMQSKAAFDKVGEAGLGRMPVGTGPMRFKQWVTDDRLTLERNGEYWRNGADGKPLPYIDSFVSRYLPDLTVGVPDIQSGQIMAAENMPANQLSVLRANPRLRVVVWPWAVTTYFMMGFNIYRPPFDNLKVRQAALYAINRDAMAKTLGYGEAQPAYYPDWTPSLAGYDDKILKYRYDPTKVKQLLNEAGYTGGIETDLLVIQREPESTIGQFAAEMWTSLGIKTTLRTLERLTWITDVRSMNFQACFWRNTPPEADPAQIVSAVSPNSPDNWSGFKDEQIAGLMQQADATMDLKARAVVYRQALTRLQEQAYLGTGYNLPFNYVLDARVRGLGAYFSIPNFKAAWVAR